MATLDETCEAQREDRATVLDRSIDAVEKVADALEHLRENIAGGGHGGSEESCDRKVPSLVYVLDTGDKRIFEQCERIKEEIGLLEDQLFGMNIIDRPAEQPPLSSEKSLPETKVSKLYSAYQRFCGTIGLIHELEKEVVEPQPKEQTDLPDPPVTENPSLEWILTQLPIGIERTYDMAMYSIKSIRETLI